MSTSDSNSSVDSDDDSSESWLDDIQSCQHDLDKIVQETEQMLSQLEHIQKKIDGPTITFQNTSKPISTWLVEWENEMNQDTFHKITWGQFVLEKLNECTKTVRNFLFYI